ncbi:endoribonuclease YbeY-like isoform X1 [Mesoplodon densirostris]|uniref:endoribonuclease YbeY-like isoform X1 n=1 Tax=Mesoplodon densirostris TaxID=48708 RepID=UPI0028DB2589|nr:endoribonuclease YbeY-like isoform X1 [Mesoplodon densirostris]
MILVLRNLQRAVPLRRARLRKKVQAVRRALWVQRFDLGVVCVDNRKIQPINRIYRDKNTPTDVLSFPFHKVTATHGLCHLLGFTHSTEAEWQKRYQKEKQVLEELSRHTGTRFLPLNRGLF